MGAVRIMVVDDEPAVREAIGRILRMGGFDVEFAADGREALRRQAVAPADAMLLDVLMPHTSTGWRCAGTCATTATGRPSSC